MKKFIEWFKDGVYDISDFLIMGAVVIVVGGIIGWKLPILFTDSNDTSIAAVETQKTNTDSKGNTDKKSPDNNTGDVKDQDGQDSNADSNTTDPKGTDKNTDKNQNSQNNNNQSNQSNQNNQNNEQKNNNNQEQNNNGETKPPKQNTNEATVVEIDIPSGSLPGTIGDILVKNNLIESKKAFLDKAVELKLDTKLRSGSYKIKSNSSLEDIIYKLAWKKK
ncbi:hypothetical protein PV797_15155 [Clostridiaceae bacterium M8S5]|nr:hypothetical protein PV797_15155 [Clostridiaceae bacterium M8S5]